MRRAWPTIVAAVALIAACTPAQSPEPSGPIVDLPGLDTRDLLPRERREFSAYVREMLAPCPNVAVPIAQCVQEKRDCDKCMPAAKVILRAVRDGMTREQVEQLYKSRFDPTAVKTIDVAGSPTKGPLDHPKVVMVEFADFECPFCQKIAPMLDATWEKHQADVLFVYKFLPLAMHPHGEISARAAIAAANQGKFWPMHDLLFANQKALERPDLDKYAQQLGLDMQKFKADFDSDATTQRIAADRALADQLGIRGTPTLYIDGRQFEGRGSFDEWIEEELAAAR
jgi:predicted DsbA family dithiol-disulfide isomerase